MKVITQLIAMSFLIGSSGVVSTITCGSPSGVGSSSWAMIKDFLYQLQNINLTEIQNSSFDLVIIDYSSDGTANGEFTKMQISALRNTGKKVVAYMSIGEAEDYRYYWQPNWTVGNPWWIVEKNPDWPGNYRVAYWNKTWQSIIYGSKSSYLDKIISVGFDGVYLDCVDVYQLPYATGHEQDMVNFVVNISNYGKTHSPYKNEFGVFPQNAPELFKHTEYLSAVNGIGKEETYFIATDKPTSASERHAAEKMLDHFFSAGLWGFGYVLEIDYADKQTNIDFVYDRCAVKGYIPYCTVVELDRMRINHGHDPSVDSTKPVIISVISKDLASVNVVFSEPVNLTSALQVWNYRIVESGTSNTISITTSAMDKNNRTVHLKTGQHKPLTNYSIIINNVSDWAGNVIRANSSFNYTTKNIIPEFREYAITTISTILAIFILTRKKMFKHF